MQGDLFKEGGIDAPLNRTEEFDQKMQRVTVDRGSVYGHPLDHFTKINYLKEGVQSCPDPVIRHVLEQICIKLARLCETPDHFDSILDIGGYARTMCMALDEGEERNANRTD